MTKKLLLLALVLALTGGTALPALAVPSVSGSAAPAISSAVTAGDGSVLSTGDLIVTPVVEAAALAPEVAQRLERAYELIRDAGSVTAFLEENPAVRAAVSAGTEDAAEEPLAVESVFEVTPVGGVAERLAAGQAVTLSFVVPGLKASQRAVVLHFSDREAWEAVPSVAGEGYVTATFTSLSPVAILVERGEAEEEPQPVRAAAPQGEGTDPSPGEESGAQSAPAGGLGVETAVGMGAAVCAAVLFLAVRKGRTG